MTFTYLVKATSYLISPNVYFLYEITLNIVICNRTLNIVLQHCMQILFLKIHLQIYYHYTIYIIVNIQLN